ncbi:MULTISPECIES: acyltransferase [Fusobacterium]|uniref:acyltransferase n=1 Tax=Fusobacterium TaxID=848 RepID=UPI001F40172B|nr:MULTISPECIES: acyltransferase family protein [Fusobacterium]MCF2611923.1 acyltransferase family protein [Fusobacterium perfoetens]MDY2981117.1 acyltransferase family protein [Fusobacterium sp.]
MKRENNIDFLKVVSSIMVIMTHISAYWVGKYLEVDSYKFSVGNFWDTLSRVAVPIFVMIAGRYALSDDRNENFKNYYKKIFKRIYIPTIIWSILYVSYNFSLKILVIFIKGKEIDLLSPIKDFILGRPFYHMWYLYMMIGVYLLAPFLIKFKKKYGENKFFKLGIIFMFIGFGIILLEKYLGKINFYERDDIFRYLKYYWYFSQFKFINFIGYFILGYSLRNKKIDTKKSLLIYLFSLSSLFLMVEKTRISEFNYDNNFIFVIIGAVSLYLFFNNLKVNYDFSKLEKHTFNIYLVHAGIISVISLFLDEILNYEPNPIWYIPFAIILVFILSLIFSIVLENILKKIKK